MLLAAQAMAAGTLMVPWVTRYVDPVMATGWHMVLGGVPLVAIMLATEQDAFVSNLALTNAGADQQAVAIDAALQAPHSNIMYNKAAAIAAPSTRWAFRGRMARMSAGGTHTHEQTAWRHCLTMLCVPPCR
jgi:hypothetical protein